MLRDDALLYTRLLERQSTMSNSAPLQKPIDRACLPSVPVAVEHSFNFALERPQLRLDRGIWPSVDKLDDSGGDALNNTLMHQG
jgi:hypothetical protein